MNRTIKIPTHAAPDGIVTTATLRRLGLSAHMITSRCRGDGPWQRLLPGVVMLGNEEPTRRQQQRAVIAYAGADTVITGHDALRAFGLAIGVPPSSRLLVPSARRVVRHPLIQAERTSRVPAPIRRDGLPFAPPARAAIDLVRSTADPMAQRAVLTVVTQRGLCTIADLRRELDVGNQRGSAAVRVALREVPHPLFAGGVTATQHRPAA